MTDSKHDTAIGPCGKAACDGHVMGCSRSDCPSHRVPPPRVADRQHQTALRCECCEWTGPESDLADRFSCPWCGETVWADQTAQSDTTTTAPITIDPDMAETQDD